MLYNIDSENDLVDELIEKAPLIEAGEEFWYNNTSNDDAGLCRFNGEHMIDFSESCDHPGNVIFRKDDLITIEELDQDLLAHKIRELFSQKAEEFMKNTKTKQMSLLCNEKPFSTVVSEIKELMNLKSILADIKSNTPPKE
jgi:hypothetical protein